MNEFGGIVANDLRERLSQPYPPASVEEEDPHKRTGMLQAGTYSMTDEFWFGVTTNLVSSRAVKEQVPAWLEEGTSKMGPRHYIARMREEWEGKFPEVITELFIQRYNQ